LEELDIFLDVGFLVMTTAGPRVACLVLRFVVSLPEWQSSFDNVRPVIDDLRNFDHRKIAPLHQFIHKAETSEMAPTGSLQELLTLYEFSSDSDEECD
jgi:hypothetical protein